MAKYAIVIGVSEYPQATGKGGLKPLSRATKDAEAVAEVLNNPQLGGFDEVIPLLNPDKTQIETTIEQIFSPRCDKQDVVLLYFSGHGIKDYRFGHLFLTAHNTNMSAGDLVKSTAVSSVTIHDFLRNCPSKRQVIILDCCYSGAFAEGLNAKDAQQLDLKNEFGGEGRAILTSSSSVELSYEREEGELSVYTDYLLEGITTGSADIDEDGWVSVDEAHTYAQKQVKNEARGMNPKIYSSEEGYKIYLTKAPATMALKRYQEQVEKCIKTGKGQISEICRATLNQWRAQLNISEQDAQQIEQNILVPLQRRQKNLKIYRDALAYALNESNPITQEHSAELLDLQKLLGLSEKDIKAIEKQFEIKTHVVKQKPSPKEPVIQTEVKPKKSYVGQVIFIAVIIGFVGFWLNNSSTPTPEHEENPVGGKVFQDTPKDGSLAPEPVKTVAGETFQLKLKDGGLAPKMVVIPKGSFRMGDIQGGGSSAEKPVHKVTIDYDFAMSQYEVTKGEFAQFIKATSYQTDAEKADGCYGWTGSNWELKKEFNWRNVGFEQEDNHPVVCVSWNDAKAYTKWLSEQTGRECRLPTESEWEYAARAGTETKYWWGNEGSHEYMNFGYKASGRDKWKYTSPVGSFAKNPFGLYDMNGNVWEWIEDSWHDNYNGAPTDGSSWKNSNKNKVLLRGGSWRNYADSCRSAVRNWYSHVNRLHNLGVRLVCSVHA
jgi:formylglycine-generating enzyme required for sulfatase activity/uncharacterized caspase-like protein